MADENKNSVPSNEGETQGQVSVDTQNTQALSQVPDTLKEKSGEELVKLYVEKEKQHKNLEKKLGEQSAEVKKARDEVKQVEVLLRAIESDPTLTKEVQKGIQSYLYGKKPEGEGDGEAATASQETKTSDDTRRFTQNGIIANFYSKYGIDKLPSDERQSEINKIGSAFGELFDPGGKKPVSQIIDTIPLEKLSQVLDTAYIHANRDKFIERGRYQESLNAMENSQASIGSLSSSTGEGGSTSLTAEQRHVAERLGIKAEDYAKHMNRK